MTLTGPALLAVVILVLTLYAGEGVVRGVKWVGHEAKRGGTAIVHVLKKIPH